MIAVNLVRGTEARADNVARRSFCSVKRVASEEEVSSAKRERATIATCKPLAGGKATRAAGQWQKTARRF